MELWASFMFKPIPLHTHRQTVIGEMLNILGDACSQEGNNTCLWEMGYSDTSYPFPSHLSPGGHNSWWLEAGGLKSSPYLNLGPHGPVMFHRNTKSCLVQNQTTSSSRSTLPLQTGISSPVFWSISQSNPEMPRNQR